MLRERGIGRALQGDLGAGIARHAKEWHGLNLEENDDYLRLRSRLENNQLF